MGGCQNYGPFFGTLCIRCRILIVGVQTGHNFDNHPHVGAKVHVSDAQRNPRVLVKHYINIHHTMKKGPPALGVQSTHVVG